MTIRGRVYQVTECKETAPTKANRQQIYDLSGADAFLRRYKQVGIWEGSKDEGETRADGVKTGSALADAGRANETQQRQGWVIDLHRRRSGVQQGIPRVRPPAVIISDCYSQLSSSLSRPRLGLPAPNQTALSFLELSSRSMIWIGIAARPPAIFMDRQCAGECAGRAGKGMQGREVRCRSSCIGCTRRKGLGRLREGETGKRSGWALASPIVVERDLKTAVTLNRVEAV